MTLINSHKIFFKNVYGQCCVNRIKSLLEENGIIVYEINNLYASISYNSKDLDEKTIENILKNIGIELVKKHEEKIVEQTKQVVFELIFEMNNMDSIVRKSDYIVQKTGYNMRYLSRLFSKYEKVSLEKYIILQKIERIKQLIIQDEYSFSEIAYMMDYSSVQYLSSQFKKMTGETLSEFKKRILST